MLLVFILIFFLLLVIFIFYRLGLLNVLQIFILGLLSILSMIIIFLMLCPTTLKDYMFFQGNFHLLLKEVPIDVLNQAKMKALSDVNNPNLGETLSNLTNNLVDILSQKPIDTNEQLTEQTKILNNIEQKLSDANIIAEVQLSQYQEGQNLALKKLSTIDNSLNTQTKKLTVAINNPTGVIDKLTSINSHVKPNLAILGELHNINYTLGQEKHILSEGFNKMLQAEGNNSLAKEIQNFSNQMDLKFNEYQVNTEKSLQNMQNEIAVERAENKKLLEQLQISSLADIELAREEAEQRIAAAEQMVNNYRKHESLGTNSSNPGINNNSRH